MERPVVRSPGAVGQARAKPTGLPPVARRSATGAARHCFAGGPYSVTPLEETHFGLILMSTG
jgi:hypothetical protein